MTSPPFEPSAAPPVDPADPTYDPAPEVPPSDPDTDPVLPDDGTPSEP